jgi:hypothetical protein
LWDASDWWARIIELALLAGILVPGVADLFRDTLTANLYWITLASFLALVLFGMLRANYNAFNAVEKRATDSESEVARLTADLAAGQRQAVIRESLGLLLLEGQQIQQMCGNEKEPAPSNQAQEWADRAEAYLSENLGQSYVARFRSGAGLPPGSTPMYWHSMEHRNLLTHLQVRLARLNQFLEELGR